MGRIVTRAGNHVQRRKAKPFRLLPDHLAQRGIKHDRRLAPDHGKLRPRREALDLVRQVRLHCGKAALFGMAHVDLETDFTGHDVARIWRSVNIADGGDARRVLHGNLLDCQYGLRRKDERILAQSHRKGARMGFPAAHADIQPAKALHSGDDTDCASISLQHGALLDMELQIRCHRQMAGRALATIADRSQRLAHRHAVLVHAGIDGPMSCTPQKMPDPIMAGEKREPSSLVQLTTVNGWRRPRPEAFSTRRISTPARTPSIPSKRPPAGWVSRWLPTAMAARPGSEPGKVANMFPMRSTSTVQPSARHSASNQRRTSPSLTREQGGHADLAIGTEACGRENVGPQPVGIDRERKRYAGRLKDRRHSTLSCGFSWKRYLKSQCEAPSMTV